MLSSLLSAKSVCRKFCKEKLKLKMTEMEWKYIEDCLTALLPCKKATLKMQNENLFPGDFFGIWHECKILTEQVKNKLAENLTKQIKEREEELLKNEALLASMFLDPRYLTFLGEPECKKAKEVLIQIWNHIESNEKNKTPSTEGVRKEATGVEEELLVDNNVTNIVDQERRKRDAESQKRFSNVSSISKLLDDFEKIPSLDGDLDLLQYWECHKKSSPELYKLANVVHAAPMTQVSVERLFSGMRFIFSTLRENLTS
ncbi:uncharacterized protein LOC122509629 [Leptopilina heterotoma]|uniref:uncharacterized protein LOC122509629 n=1 Tax=Leptopilina heterotoma TaxID=63436 RepID=UPI001CA8EBAF|nr:uncharacterized protein LOC122509629 [Leptopilina heterotoma]